MLVNHITQVPIFPHNNTGNNKYDTNMNDYRGVDLVLHIDSVLYNKHVNKYIRTNWPTESRHSHNKNSLVHNQSTDSLAHDISISRNVWLAVLSTWMLSPPWFALGEAEAATDVGFPYRFFNMSRCDE
jgi:hypothetical protein